MIARCLAVAFLLPCAVRADLVLSAGTPETQLGSTFDFGKVAVGDTKDVRIRARNTGISEITVTTLLVSGAGFSSPDKPSLPYKIAPGNFLDVTVHFAAGSAATYSANFQVNSSSVLLLATVAPAATLSSGVGCTGPADIPNIDFGNVISGSTGSCIYSLRNMNAQPVTISTFSVSGSGFSGPQGVRAPLTLLAGEIVSFTIAFAPSAPGIYSGAMTIESRIYKLSGTAVSPQLPLPIVNYESAALQSGQQRRLTLSLPFPAPVSASGNIALSFTPDTPLVKDDPSVMFAATGSRSLPYTVKQGDTQILLNGQAAAVFQTGTTSGRIRFTLSSNVPLQGDPNTVLTVPPAKMVFDSAFASRRTGVLDVQITGFDNTYTAGSMAFTFYDTSGRALDGGFLNADFSAGFRDYFSKAQAGGVFKAAITFPVSGDAAQIGSVEVQLSNSVSVTTQRLTFP